MLLTDKEKKENWARNMLEYGIKIIVEIGGAYYLSTDKW